MTTHGKKKSNWPIKLDASLIAGAMEVGKDLFLLGAFGGFGGHLHPEAYPTIEEAIEAAKSWNAKQMHHVSVFRVQCRLEVE